MNNEQKIIKSAGAVSALTFLSRVLGFIRDITIARFSGIYLYTQAFVVAFRIPNLLRDLFAEGLANSSFVPVFTEYLIKKPQEFWKLTRVVLFLLLLIVSLITILGIISSPLIVQVIAPGFRANPEQLNITIKLTRFFFPYLILISLSAYGMGILNSFKHFLIPGFSPCLLNISLIFFLLLYGEGEKSLIYGVLIGGALQFLIQVPMLYKKGFRFALPDRLSHPGAKKIITIMAPRIFSSAIYYLNNFVDTIFGSFSKIVGEGAVAGLYLSYRIIQFPLGLFSTALFQVVLPTFSTQVVNIQYQQLKHTLSFVLRIVFFILLPISIYFIFFSEDIISLIFRGGKFDDYAVKMCSGILSFYSLGLFAYGANKILQGCFFSLQDTITPTKVSLLALFINIVLNSILIFPLKINGVALATSISAIISFFILLFIINKRLTEINLKEIKDSFLRILFASLCGAFFTYKLWRFFLFSSQNIFIRFSALLILFFLSISFFALFSFIFRVKEFKEVFLWIFKK